MTSPNPVLLIAALAVGSPSVLLAAPQGEDKVDFVTQIQPIFAASCYECHGPDEQEADLRLDEKSSVFHDGGPDQWVIVPGDAEKSEVHARITLPEDDPDIMPPEGDLLTKEQVALIRAWINQGAEWPDSAAGAAEEARPLVQPVVVPELTPAEAAKQDKAIEAIRARGALAIKVAANTAAVDANFSLVGGDIKDADLRHLGGLEKTLVWLNLSRTSVTDAGLSQLTAHTQLRRLNLAQTGIGDAGLRSLTPLKKLEYLNLYGTAVTDAGLVHLRGLAALKKLYLWQTKVTDDGVAALKKALPGVYVDLGRYAEEILEVAKKRAPTNEKCPVTDKAIVSAFVFVHEGKSIGFCCEKCLAKFAKEPAKFKDKLGK